ncbi:MAG TPA: hypothetical protein VMF65_22220, partial [Acidimicrobiales bacterium]|nr:hypothetical protein [Acidimicrobiales bacterium]
MNWNNVQLDERAPLTIRTCPTVGDILRHVPDSERPATLRQVHVSSGRNYRAAQLATRTRQCDEPIFVFLLW